MNTALVKASAEFIKDVGFPIFMGVYTMWALTHTLHKLTNAIIALQRRRNRRRPNHADHHQKRD